MTYNETPAEARKIWTEGLRSGIYSQAKECLEHHDPAGNLLGHCCLGVACDLFKQRYPDLTSTSLMEIPHSKDQRRWFKVGDGYAESTILPNAIKEWLGLHDHTATSRKEKANELEAKYPGSMRSLALLNDHGGLGFEQIAELIDEGFLETTDENA